MTKTTTATVNIKYVSRHTSSSTDTKAIGHACYETENGEAGHLDTEFASHYFVGADFVGRGTDSLYREIDRAVTDAFDVRGYAVTHVHNDWEESSGGWFATGGTITREYEVTKSHPATEIARVGIGFVTSAEGDEVMVHGKACFWIEDGASGDLNTNFEARYFSDPDLASEHIDDQVIRAFAEAGYDAENAGTEDAGYNETPTAGSTTREYKITAFDFA